MMDPDYTLFAEVVAAGSLSGAARRLRLSPAMVSKRLARLEVRLGVQLAHRTTRRLVTTAAGQRFYDDVVAILSSAHEAEARARGTKEPVGRLHISAPTSFGRLHVAPYLQGFMTAFPRVELEIDLTDSLVDIVGDRIDLAIRITAGADPELTTHRLAANHRILCASPTYIEAYGTPRVLPDLARHRLLAASAQSPWRMEGPEGLILFDAESAVRTNSSEVVRELALSGVGIAFRSTWDVADDLRTGRLLRILPDYQGATDVAIHAVHPRALRVPPAVTEFIAHLGRCYGDVPPWDRPLRPNPIG